MSEYRAWDLDNKVMLYSSTEEYPFIANDQHIKVVNDGVLYAAAPDMSHYGGGEWSYRIGNFVMMPFTGRKDINGKVVAQGDIIGFPDAFAYGEGEETISIGVIKWDEDYVQFYVTNRLSVSIEYFWETIDLAEVIGNIYENPELLECK